MCTSGFIFILLCFIFKTNASFVEDYCWRDYDGDAPSDALKAGMDRDKNPIYIGQTLFKDKLIPGKIHHGSNEIHIEFFTAHTVNETIKILCTQHPEHFQWVNTSTNEVLDLKKKHNLFKGGYEKTVTTYIGRAVSFNELTIGKVICWPTYCIPLTTVENGQFYTHPHFEILTYDPKATKENSISEPIEDIPHDAQLVIPQRTVAPGWYIALVLGTAVLIVVIILIVRRC